MWSVSPPEAYFTSLPSHCSALKIQNKHGSYSQRCCCFYFYPYAVFMGHCNLMSGRSLVYHAHKKCAVKSPLGVLGGGLIVFIVKGLPVTRLLILHLLPFCTEVSLIHFLLDRTFFFFQEICHLKSKKKKKKAEVLFSTPTYDMNYNPVWTKSGKSPRRNPVIPRIVKKIW